jgi:hypothetical protein
MNGARKGGKIRPQGLTSQLDQLGGQVTSTHEKGQLIRFLVKLVVCSPDGEIRVVFRTDK